MTKKPVPKSIKLIADALTSPQQSTKAQKVAAREVQKDTERSNARIAIYSALSDWVGETVQQGEPIPIYREGKHLGTLPNSLIRQGWEVDQIVEASKLLSVAELRRQRKSLSKLADLTEKLAMGMNDLDLMDLLRLENYPKDYSGDTEVKVLRAIGTISSTFISLSDLSTGIHLKIKELDEKIAKPGSKLGRPKNEATHGVALGLAKFYARVCGKRPTYSEGPNGLSGEYTPALRKVFDALGWQSVSLKSPAEAAIAKISDDDLDAKLIPMENRLLSYLK